MRIIAAPAIFLLVVLSGDGHSAAASLVFLGAALTDFIDGRLARHTETVSEFGRQLDPFADRVFISSTVIALAIRGVFPWWAVALVVARDVFMILGYKVLARRRVILHVSFLGKSYTALLMAAIVVAIAGFKPGGFELGKALFLLGVAGSLISAAAYIAKGVSMMDQAREPEEQRA